MKRLARFRLLNYLSSRGSRSFNVGLKLFSLSNPAINVGRSFATETSDTCLLGAINIGADVSSAWFFAYLYLISGAVQSV